MVKSFHHENPWKTTLYSNSWDAEILRGHNRFPPIFRHKSIRKRILFFSRQERQLQASKKERKTAIQQVPICGKVLNLPCLVNFLDSEAKALEAIVLRWWFSHSPQKRVTSCIVVPSSWICFFKVIF